MRATILVLLAATTACSNAQIPFSKTHRAQLSHSKLRVFYPSYIPAGFRETSFSFDDHSAEMADFHVTYANGRGASFSIQMSSEGIGDMIFTGKNGEEAHTTSRQTVHSQALGDVAIERSDAPGYKQFHMDWQELPRASRPKYVSVMGVGIDRATSVRIIKGLRYFRR